MKRQGEEEINEAPKRLMMQERARRFYLRIIFEASDLNIEQYTGVQNAIQCYHVVYDEKKRATT